MLDEFSPQQLSITAWSFASLSVGAKTLMKAISAAALSHLDEFASLELSNTVWALAKVQITNSPLR